MVGLALGGGSGRGISHIGFLRWLDEHRVPVDLLAGTSIGGLIGGGYAAGMSPSELESLMRGTDWDLMFLSDSPFKYKTFRRKEDARQFPAQIDLGLKGGVHFPSGINTGQQVELMLDRIAAPYYGVGNFDDLPTPFRAVATDLRSASVVVLGSGSLSQAMRATMAIPGVFTPVTLDGRILVDGGTLDNVPADVVRQMGAEVVIAVDVSSTTDGAGPPSSLFDVLGQTMDAMMAVGVRQALASADLVVAPDLRGLTGRDWVKTDELVERGYAAAEANADRLLAYALDPASYASWRERRESRRREDLPRIDRVRVEGLDEAAAKRIEVRLSGRLAGRPCDLDAIEREILDLSGTDRYEIVRYTLEREAEETALAIFATPKSHGPPFLLPAVDLQNIDSNSFALNLRGRIVSYDFVVPDSEFRVDVALGTRQTMAAELYRRIADSRVFFAPRGYLTRKSLNGYDDGRFLAEYRDTTAGAGADLGLDLGTKNEVRLGFDAAEVRTRLRIGEPSLPEAAGSNRFASIRWTFDGQTSPVIPTRGVYSRFSLRYYFASPDLTFADETVPGARDYTQAEARVSYFRSWKQRHRMFFGASGGTSFTDDPGYNAFRLGGLLRLGAFNNDQLSGRNYGLALGGLLYQVVRLPAVVGGNGYLGTWLETGSAFDRWNSAGIYWNVSGGLVLETFLGPVFMGGSVSLTNKDGRFYVNVGPFVR